MTVMINFVNQSQQYKMQIKLQKFILKFCLNTISWYMIASFDQVCIVFCKINSLIRSTI